MEEHSKAATGNLPLPPDKHPTTVQHLVPAEKEFIETLQEDVKRINDHFMEEEEQAVIRLQALKDRQRGSVEDLKALTAAFINLHGELILLFHYSMVNYAGVLKILKKHDKMLLEAAGDRKRNHLRNLLQQPFTSTENISRLVREAEEEIRLLGAPLGTTTPASLSSDIIDDANRKRENDGNGEDEAQLMKRTRAALNMLEQLQQTAHTPSTLLPAPQQPLLSQGKN